VEPVAFEVLRSASVQEAKLLEEQFKTLPLLQTPSTIWREAIKLGQACRSRNYTIGPIDLLIAAISIYYNAELVTFDTDFNHIAENSKLRLKILARPIQ
jgi:predicted nucleic acid-binding protein